MSISIICSIIFIALGALLFVLDVVAACRDILNDDSPFKLTTVTSAMIAGILITGGITELTDRTPMSSTAAGLSVASLLLAAVVVALQFYQIANTRTGTTARSLNTSDTEKECE